MTDVSYTAWDDKQYQWPPPEGWYQASDGKWWPEGYGPPVVEEATDTVEEVAAEAEPHEADGSFEAESSYEAGSAAYTASSTYEAADAAASTTVAESHSVADAVTTKIEDSPGSGSGLAGWAEPSNGAYDPVDSVLSMADDAGLAESEAFESVVGSVSVDETMGDAAASAESAVAAAADDVVADDVVADEVVVDDVVGDDVVADDVVADDVVADDVVAEDPAAEIAADDVGAEPGGAEAEMDRLEDLQRQAESRSFDELAVGGADAELPPLDPTETVDIDPDDINPESNPYYGQAVTAPIDPSIESPQTTIGAAPVGHVDQFDSATHPELSRSPILTPASTPPPTSGSGRRLLYVVLGVLALLAAGIAGYLLFQLQDDSDTDADGDSAAAAVVVDNGELGSLSRPHDLAKGIRINYQTENGDQQPWVLEVLEPATVTGDEVMANLRLRNDSTTRSVPLSELRFNLVTADGSTIVEANESCSGGSDLDTQTPVDPGGQLSGSVCWTASADQAEGALLGVESTKVSGRVHVRLS